MNIKKPDNIATWKPMVPGKWPSDMGERKPVGGMYKKRFVVVRADLWWKNGDHPLDGDERFAEGEFEGELYEGKVVRYYRTPDNDGQDECKYCTDIMHNHGWIDTMEGGHIVCPGDWIITGIEGEFYPCKPAIFEKTYIDYESKDSLPGVYKVKVRDRTSFYVLAHNWKELEENSLRWLNIGLDENRKFKKFEFESLERLGPILI